MSRSSSWRHCWLAMLATSQGWLMLGLLGLQGAVMMLLAAG
jgi:hypothetical protein